MMSTQEKRIARCLGSDMGIEINRARVAADGTVSCEFVFPNIGSFVRVANDALRVEPAGFEPPKPADYYAEAEARLHIAAEREAKREAAQTATGRRIPRATVAGGFMSLDDEEPPLRAGEALQDIKAGGTSSDD